MAPQIPQSLQEATRILEASPAVEEFIPNTGLRLIHVWKEQILSAARTDGQDLARRTHQFVVDTYRPFTSPMAVSLPQGGKPPPVGRNGDSRDL